MAPVFTCFKNDESLTLDVSNVDKYANWLKSHNVSGILVNSITGEGPALNFLERMRNTEAWWEASLKYDFTLMVQIGGAPLPNVLELAEHAEHLGVHAVLCLPELFYRPKSLQQLVGYCKIVAQKCTTRPFFYYHIPVFTQVHFDMADFCLMAEESIPNFYGVMYQSNDLDMGTRCLRQGRVILLGRGSLLASGMIVGFESGAMTILNIRPDMAWAIYNAMKKNDGEVAIRLQRELNQMIWSKMIFSMRPDFVPLMKKWFNEERMAGFIAGPSRRFF